MIDFHISNVLAKIGFTASFLSNFFVIYLTLFHIKKLAGTYKNMVITFAICGIIFTSAEVIARPFAHNYNKSVIFFSFNTYLPRSLVKFVLVSWAGLYIVILSLITVQFFYRFLCLLHIQKTKQFDNMPSIIWMIYPFVPSVFYGLSLYLLCMPDEYSDSFGKEIILENYGLVIEDLVRLAVIPYASDNSLRWKNLLFLLLSVLLVWFHYAIMLYCGFKMHFNMKQELKKFSFRHRKLHKQFFYALVVQSLGPTVLLVIPVAPILLIPLIHPYTNVEIDWQTGWLYSLLGLYPPFDSIAFMLIVTEYRKVIKSQLLYMLTNHPFQESASVTNTTDPRNRPAV